VPFISSSVFSMNCSCFGWPRLPSMSTPLSPSWMLILFRLSLDFISSEKRLPKVSSPCRLLPFMCCFAGFIT